MHVEHPRHGGRALHVLGALAAALMLTNWGCHPVFSLGSDGAGGSGSSGSSSGGTQGTASGSGTGVCPGIPCAGDLVCCLLDGKCFDPSTSPDACVVPPGFMPASDEGAACASQADCDPTELCMSENPLLCLGPGFCQARDNTGTGNFPMCGCDSKTYPDRPSVGLAGIRIVGEGPCGTAPGSPGSGEGGGLPGALCGTAGECPTSGEACCPITGRCYDASKPALCRFPPDGTWFPCIDNSQCLGEICQGDGCGTPGGCKAASNTCGGQLQPVCGCDGKSYTNADCATAARTRVAHDGACM